MTHPVHRPRRLAGAAALALALPLVAAPSVGLAQDAPTIRAIDDACLGASQTVDRFEDVTAGTHRGAVNCLEAFGVTQGTTGPGHGRFYEPIGTVSRQQMASFVNRTLGAVRPAVFPPEEFDPDVDPAFPDDGITDVHQGAVDRLVELGIVEGREDGSFGPSEPVTRAQVTSFLVRALELVLDEELPREVSFPDVGGVHQANVEKLASVGIVGGTGNGLFSPDLPLRRDQMASVLARSLDLLTERGAVYGLDVAPGEAGFLGVVDLRHGVQADATERLAFELDGDDASAGWRVQAVDEARSQGSGELVDVDGEAIIQVILTGMALPPDLPQEIQDRLVTGDGPFAFEDADLVVEVVDDSIFEGQHVFFVGVSEPVTFTVGRDLDPQVVFLDLAASGAATADAG